MAATIKKNEIPKITKKWYDFKIDPKTLRPVRFSWNLVTGTKIVEIYGDVKKQKEDIMHASLRNCIHSYYFVLDKVNKRIFAYPVQMVNHMTRSECKTAHYQKINCNSFYMWDENKQLWEVPYKEYRKYVRYDWATRTSIYEDVPAQPRKISRLSTYYYKVQCQLPSHIRAMFATLFGNDFIYQNKLITDNDILSNHWYWHKWLDTKGRKYSDKTIKSVNEIMDKFSTERRINSTGKDSNVYYSCVTLETNNDITALCYFSQGQETFRQIFNAKTGKMDNFIWKDNKWQKTGKLSDWQNILNFTIKDSYIKANQHDGQILNEAYRHYCNRQHDGRYWYSPEKNMYNFTRQYLSKPVISQLLQIQNVESRKEMYKNAGNIQDIYGQIPNRGKTMFAKLGINKYQFNHPKIIPYIKWLLGTTNISHIDQQTWDKYTMVFTDTKINSWYDAEIIQFLKSKGEFSVDRWIKIYTLNLNHTTSQNYYSQNIKTLYKDYYKSLSAMDEFGIDISAYPLLFNTKEQLHRYHDEAARAVSGVRNKAADEKFKMLYDKRHNMLENDGKYLIDMPQSSVDLTTEGSMLHHCVGGYVNSVANGSTAIYFLRQASEPNTPWLTVEISNKQCRQIHGACNAWMGSKDEYFDAVPFLVWWFDKHDIAYDENLLTNMATGYGQSSSRRDMPVDKIEAYKQSKKLKKS